MSRRDPPLSADRLRARFDEPAPLTVGIEEELMVLDATTLDLVPRGPELVRAAGDPRVRPELPASQVEFATAPATAVPEAIAELAEGRALLAAAAAPLGLALAAAGTHPFAAASGPLSPGERYAELAKEHGPIANRQLTCALQVHVCVRGADRALAVHDALRSYLPLIAALAAHAPFHVGADTGHASIRPAIAALLPRHGVPPALRDWETLAEAVALLDDASRWWWDLRPHMRYGTLEVRVGDAQATLAEAEAVASVAHALVAWLAARHDAGEALPVEETWRIEHDGWLAARHGVVGPLGERVAELLEGIEPTARQIGCARGIERARTVLADGGGATRLRASAGDPPDLRAAVRSLTRRFGEPPLG